jgi:hypothetical protein
VKSWVVEDGTYKQEAVSGMHVCTDKEMAKFYPRAVGARKDFDYLEK